MRAPRADKPQRKNCMNQSLRRETSHSPAIRNELNFACRTIRESRLRTRPIEPGYYLIRLRLRYGTKGIRPLANIA